MIKVCFLIGGLQGNGGIGRVVSILANEISKDSRFEVSIVSYFEEKEKKRLYNLNSRVSSTVIFSKPCSMSKGIIFKHVIRTLHKLLETKQIDILIPCGALFFPLGILACRNTKAICICCEHTDPATTSDYRFQKACRIFASKKSDYLVVLTKSAEKYYQAFFPQSKDKLLQIYNPICNDAIQSTAYDTSSHKIISVGRLTYQKNFERLIEIAAEILPRNTGWEWDIYGEGELRSKLQDLINAKKISDQLVLKGLADDICYRYQNYSFMVMTSRYEGFPMTLLEGLANRLPLISFDIQTGPSEIIQDGANGYLIDKDDDQKMEIMIQKLIDDESLREKMSNEALIKSKLFAIDAITDSWKCLFLQVEGLD